LRKHHAAACKTGPADCDVTEVVHDRHGLQRARQAGDGLHLVGAFINTAVEPVHDGVAARLAVVEILRADDLALGREIDLHGVVAARERMPPHVVTAGLAGPDAAGEPLVHERAVLLHDLVPLASVAPVEAAVGMQEGAVHIRGVAGVLEASDDHLALVGDAVVIRVRKLPQSRRRAHVERAIQPASALREGHLVRVDGALVEDAVLVRVLEHEDAIRRVGLELLLVPVHAGAVAHEKATAIIEAAHDGMRHQGSGGGDGKLHALGQDGLGDLRFEN
jgi:hypothetical protein